MSIFDVLFGGFSARNENIKLLSTSEFKAMIRGKKVQLIDIRTPREYRNGHLPSAVNIDFFSSDFTTQFDRFDKAKPLYIYCRSGARSRSASMKLAKMGFEKIFDLKGGIAQWEWNYPVRIYK